MTEEQEHLGFSFRQLKSGEVEVVHHGRRASVLRGHDAQAFLAEVKGQSLGEAQQHMARITGNYRRGNERLASQHQRNRR